MSTAEIYTIISGIAPICYIEFPSYDKKTWKIGFLPEATEAQQQAAYAALLEAQLN